MVEHLGRSVLLRELGGGDVGLSPLLLNFFHALHHFRAASGCRQCDSAGQPRRGVPAKGTETSNRGRSNRRGSLHVEIASVAPFVPVLPVSNARKATESNCRALSARAVSGECGSAARIPSGQRLA
jgi:hypothetical protein